MTMPFQPVPPKIRHTVYHVLYSAGDCGRWRRWFVRKVSTHGVVETLYLHPRKTDAIRSAVDRAWSDIAYSEKYGVPETVEILIHRKDGKLCKNGKRTYSTHLDPSL